MSSSFQRLEKENSHWIGHYFIVLTIIATIVVVIKCLSRNDGLQLLLSFFGSFNILDILLITAIVFYGRYFFAMNQRKVFLARGTRYDAEIIDIIPSTHRVVQYLKFKIQYGGNKIFITPMYNEDPKYKLVSQKCSIYVYKNKCYADDFVLERIIKPERPKMQITDIEGCMMEEMDHPDYNRKDFIEKRQAACYMKSDTCLCCRPLLILLADNRFVTYIIDIPIQSKKPQEIPSTFDFAIRKYVMNTFSNYSSAEIEKMTNQLRDFIVEIFDDYFPHATLVDVKIRRIK